MLKNSNAVKILTAGVATVGLFALSACGGANSATDQNDQSETTSVTFGAAPSLFSLGVRTAVEEGLFEERGLDVEVVDIQSAAEGAALLANGDVQFSTFDVHNGILAVSEGQDTQITVPVSYTATEPSDDPHGFGTMVVATDGEIQDPKDLEGKKIGTNTVGGTAYLDFYQKLESEGVDMSTVEWIQVPGPQQVSSVKQGQVDAAVSAEPGVSIGLAEGSVEPLMHADDVMRGAPNFGFASSKQWADSNPEVLEDVRSAVLEANKMLNSDRELAEEMVVSYMDLDEEVVSMIKFPHYAEEPFTVEGIEPVADRLIEFELLSEDEMPDLSEVLYTSE